jgi:hypothetical protein
MKYDIAEFVTKDLDIEITELWITWRDIPAEYDEDGKETKPASVVPHLRYRYKPTKDGKSVPWHGKDRVHCDFDEALAQAGKDFALNHFKSREEVTTKETA